LRKAPVRILLIGQIASPIREILRKQQNATVVMGEVIGVDKEKKLVFANSADRERVPLPYGYLFLAIATVSA
jgi:NADH dehydrogenase